MKINKVYLSIGLVVLGLGVVVFMAVYVVPQVLVTLTRAAPASKVSPTNSYFIGGKLLAVADGKDFGVVNVFALDATGKGVKNKSVEVTGMGEEVLTGVTDVNGKASFEVKSATGGQFKLTATIDGVAVGKVVVVTFRN